MLRFLVLACLASTFAIFGFKGTLLAAPQTGDASILIKCSTCGVDFTSKSATEQHMKGLPEHKVTTPTHPLIKCSTCGVDLTSHVSLKKHLQGNPDHQRGPLVKCSTCGVEFSPPGL